MSTLEAPPGRREQIAAGLAVTRQRLQRACEAAGRDPGDVTLVVVTKTFPASDVRLLHALGVRDVGENRHPEAGAKADACADLDLRWHYVGQLQTNKARVVAGYADVVHSVDRVRLVDALARGVPDGSRARLPRAGLARPAVGPTAVAGHCRATCRPSLQRSRRARRCGCAASWRWLRWEQTRTRRSRGSLRSSRALRERWPEAEAISAGMSGDLEAAVRHGATHVRVGSAILGTRPAAR